MNNMNCNNNTNGPCNNNQRNSSAYPMNCQGCGNNNNQNYNQNTNQNYNQNYNQMQQSRNIRADKKVLMQNIYELGFVLTETNLYLDTHPDDTEAIEYYTQMKEKYHEYMTKYSDYHGPLDKMHMSNDNYWMWVATPMPWEMEGC